jgi:hypothetical protein
MKKVTGFTQATGVALYIGLVVTILGNGEKVFGKFNQFTGFALMLLLLSTLILICALLVFAQPYRLFLDKKGKEALQLVIATTK